MNTANDTSTPLPLMQQVTIAELPGVCTALIAELGLSDAAAERRAEALSRATGAHCVQCRIHLTGAELFRLAAPHEAPGLADPRLQRLQQGYCARNGCDSIFYLVELAAGLGIEWPAVLARRDVELAKERERQAPGEARREPALKVDRRSFTGKVLIGGILLLLLALIRQWYRGGRIPFLREPRAFEGDPASRRAAPER